jgi:hypothetical protein
LQQDFAAHAEGLAAEKEFGEHGLKLAEEVFRAWEIFQHTDDWRELQHTVTRLARTYQPIIAGYAAKRARNKRCRGMARSLLKAWPALWSFAKHNGVQPTNNHAERALRSAVIYRKLSSEPNPPTESDESSGCYPHTPPAGSSTARYSTIWANSSPPTPVVTPHHYTLSDTNRTLTGYPPLAYRP